MRPRGTTWTTQELVLYHAGHESGLYIGMRTVYSIYNWKQRNVSLECDRVMTTPRKVIKTREMRGKHARGKVSLSVLLAFSSAVTTRYLYCENVFFKFI